MKVNQTNNGITLVALVITTIVLLILAGVVISISLGQNGLLNRVDESKEETDKQTATEIINLKITTAQMNSYTKKQRMPTLQELADVFCEDNEIQYVTLESKVASKEKINSMFYPNNRMELTLSDNKVTIPRNGWLYIYFYKATQGDYWNAYRNERNIMSVACHEKNTVDTVYIPVKEGDSILVSEQSYFTLYLDYYEKDEDLS